MCDSDAVKMGIVTVVRAGTKVVARSPLTKGLAALVSNLPYEEEIWSVGFGLSSEGIGF